MALIRCPECGREISSQARACPACGYPVEPGREKSLAEGHALHSPGLWSKAVVALGAWLVTPWIAKLIVALAVCVLAYFMFTGH